VLGGEQLGAYRVRRRAGPAGPAGPAGRAARIRAARSNAARRTGADRSAGARAAEDGFRELPGPNPAPCFVACSPRAALRRVGNLPCPPFESNSMANKQVNTLMAAAIAALIAGAAPLAGCKTNSDAQATADRADFGKVEKHACKGMNACKSQGGCKAGDHGCAGMNSCKGHGGCATTDKHACKSMNACKGLGGCASGDNGCVGKNSCKGHGGCAVPVKHMAH